MSTQLNQNLLNKEFEDVLGCVLSMMVSSHNGCVAGHTCYFVRMYDRKSSARICSIKPMKSESTLKAFIVIYHKDLFTASQ